MPPAVVSSTERRKSEDLHFGNQRAPSESLLGQALQLPSLGQQNYQSSDDSHDDELPFSYESLTPTFATTRKRSGDGRTPLKTNGSSHHGRRQVLQHSGSSNLTRVVDNRYHHSSGNVSGGSSSQDPLCMSSRSLQSDDYPAVVPQSVDTVPTNNLTTTYQHYLHHKQRQHNHNGNNHHYNAELHGGVSQILNGTAAHPTYHNNHHRLNTSPSQPRMSVSPPSNLLLQPTQQQQQRQPQQHRSSTTSSHTSGTGTSSSTVTGTGRRNVFGARVQQKYPAYGSRPFPHPPPPPPPDRAPFYNIIDTGEQITFQQAEQQPPDWEILPSSPRPVRNSVTSVTKETQQGLPIPLSMVVTTSTTSTTTLSSDSSLFVQQPTTTTTTEESIPLVSTTANHAATNDHKPTEPLSPPASPPQPPRIQNTPADMVSPLNSPSFLTPQPTSYQTSSHMISQQGNNNNRSNTTPTKSIKRRKPSRKSSKNRDETNISTKSISIHETVHAQSLLLGLCFMAIWSPNNIMAPNLTQVAKFYHMNENERDLYLGSFLALATGVFSFPLSAFIGILTDLYSRKILFVATAFGGAIASAATGLSPTYPHLLLARFFSGGFMSASVSVAFSLMGDLFATEERNAASSGLTAMMGLGIILGQVYAGTIGNEKGWQHAFYVSSMSTVVLGVCVALLVQEPVRGGKEKVLQDMLKQGKRYDRKLTWEGFWNAMRNNRSNRIIITQGFFTNIPWGIIFVFLNDYLSQERGFSVTDATFIVLVFGIGCAAGGIVGGALGAKVQAIRRSFLPLFMAGTTILGIFPYLALLNGHTTNAHGYWAMTYSFMAGCIANLPSVNVRPCLINVNPPETRGASLTAANLIINFARGVGPSFITLLGSTFDLSRQASFNITLTSFWIISALQLFLLAQYLPQDQDMMEAELAHYAASALATTSTGTLPRAPDAAPTTPGDRSYGSNSMIEYASDPELPHAMQSTRSIDEVSLVSIEDRITSFDGTAARESIYFFKKGVKELNIRGNFCASPYRHHEHWEDEDEEDDDEEEEQKREDALKLLTNRSEGDDPLSPIDFLKRRDLWKQQQLKLYGSTARDEIEVQLEPEEEPANESTRLLV